MLKTVGGSYSVGHVFVGFSKENTDGPSVQQIFGFYPAGSAGATPVKGKIVDDSGRSYDVRYPIEVSKDQFFNAITQVQQDVRTNKKYMLHDLTDSEYNCGDAALSWVRAGGISIPDAPRGAFNNAPSDLGQALRKKSGAIIKTGKADYGSGSCN